MPADCRAGPDRCIPPLSAGAIDVARELADSVPGLKVTDGIILAHAMADPGCISRDERPCAGNNAAIIPCEKKARAEERRNTLLRILDPIEESPAF